MENKLQRIRSEEYLLDHGELARYPDKGDSGDVNLPCFRTDVIQHRLGRYKGTYVAYHKGVFCGQSRDRDILYEEATSYYGKSNLAVFKVPKNLESLDKDLEEAVGYY